MNKKTIIIFSATIGALLILAILFLLATVKKEQQGREDALQQIEQLKLDNENMAAATELAELNSQFAQHENEAIKLENDSILAKYNSAKARVEQLINELNSEKKKSREEMDKLRNEIGTLRGLLRHYVAMVDSLSKENAQLKVENAEVKEHNQQLTNKVSAVEKENEHLSQRMTLAEKLNVTGLQLTPLNKKGKTEKNVTKAKQLMVTFTIPQNNSTPVGLKTIYVRITGPEGNLLGSAGSFSFEGHSLQCSAKKTLDYAGDEISGIQIYWDVDTTLNPGDYTVELFADNFRLISRHFTLKK